MSIRIISYFYPRSHIKLHVQNQQDGVKRYKSAKECFDVTFDQKESVHLDHVLVLPTADCNLQSIVGEVIGSNLGPNRVITKDVKSFTFATMVNALKVRVC